MHATPRRRLRPRWLWSALVLIAVTAATLWLIRLQETACAGVPGREVPTTPAGTLSTPGTPGGTSPAASLSGTPSATGDPRPGPVQSGTAVYHDDWSVVLCSLMPLPSGGHHVSVSADAFDGAALCGGYLDVTGPQGTVRVQIVDRCRGCAPGRIDLSKDAFARIGDLGKGIVPVRYRLVRDPMPPHRLAFRVKQGSTAEWLALLVLDHGNPIDRLELRGADRESWRPLRRGVDNYWTISGAGSGPFQVRVSDRYGRRVVVRRLTLSPGGTQRTSTRLYEPRPAPFTATESPMPVPVPPGPAESSRSSKVPVTSPRCP